MIGRIPRMAWWGIALVVASLLLGVLLTMGSAVGVPSAALYLSAFDRPISNLMALTRAHSSGRTISVAQALSWIGSASVRGAFILAAVVLLVLRHHARDAVLFVIVVAITIATNTAFKEIFGRVRPALVPWLDDPQNLSYPSGHSANSMVVMLLATLLIGDRRLVWAALVLVVAIGLSRVSLGVHWPTDVVGGWMYGAGAALIGASLSRGIERAPRSSGRR
jgi:membrane-associated phospholipid phosphatase